MSLVIRKMGLCFWVCFFCFCFCFCFCFVNPSSNSVVDDGVIEGSISIDGRAPIGIIDGDFVCATLDWWPPEKCDYGTCSWGLASILNLDLNNNILLNAVRAFSPLKLRLGGSLQDMVIYDTKDRQQPCLPFTRNASESFGFSQGCLPLHRWDQLNDFFAKSGAKVIFGLNALTGRKIASNRSAVGAWNYTNAESLINYTVQKNYTIHGWELGNELSGNEVGPIVSADQYSSDTIALQNVVHRAYTGIEPKPLIIAPGGGFNKNWFGEFINKTVQSIDVITHHIYSLGSGDRKDLIENILNPSYLDGVANLFSNLHKILSASATSAVAWVGEAGGAYNSGQNLVTNAFVSSFWYLDQLGMASIFDTKTYCRQTLIGGNYGLLDTMNFVPNPDYYSALLWHRLMGRNVLSVSFNATKNIRAYAHCAKQSEGITLLLINLAKNTTVEVDPAFDISTRFNYKPKSRESKIILLPPRVYEQEVREEYQITPKDGDLHSQIMLLNGNNLEVSSNGEIPPLEPVYVNGSEPIIVSPFSIVFAHIPNLLLPACSWIEL